MPVSWRGRDTLRAGAEGITRGFQGVGMNDNVMPADLTLRAVPLSAGRHHFLMKYRPGIFDIGKTVSEFSWLAFGIASFLVFRPRKKTKGL